MINRRCLISLFLALLISFSFVITLAPRAEAVQASGSVAILPSDFTLVKGQEITLTLRIYNTSTDTMPTGTGNVAATFNGTLTATLACSTSTCLVELPGTLVYIDCDALVAEVTSCTLSGDNQVLINISDLTLPIGGYIDVAMITVEATVPICAADGLFYVRGESGPDDMEACDSENPGICATGGAEGSAPVFFPCVCGDGIVGNTTGETCDPPGDPVGSEGEYCRENCTFCGDGVVDTGEDCDDGNEIDGDGCNSDCLFACGDGTVGNTTGETCDPPGDPVGSEGEYCRENCTFCGDGIVDEGEDCDDGNEVNGDGCENDCTISREEICRTPGFWGTHAGEEKEGKSQNIAQAVIDAAGGCLEVCGEVITTTEVGNAESALEAICVSPRGNQKLQLARQLTAMALNCIISGGGPTCTAMSCEDIFLECNNVCAGDTGMYSIQECIMMVDSWNNGGYLEDGCHSRQLCNEDIGLCFEPPGPAGSPKACTAARKNDCTILMPGESECDMGLADYEMEVCQ
jgi:cysteine-rich repeat protein